MAQVTLPDGSTLVATEDATIRDITEKIGPGLAKAAVAARINGDLVDLSLPIRGDVALQIVTLRDDDGLDIMRHSCAHVMAEALCSLWPETKLVYGPTVANGFYYDIDLDEPIRPADFERIEAKMAEIIKADYPLVREDVSREVEECL